MASGWKSRLGGGWTRADVVSYDQDSALSQVWYVSYPSGEARRVTNDLDDYRDLSLAADSQAMAVVRSGQQATFGSCPKPMRAEPCK